ncbi:MAG: hypothetical protein M3271_06500 [Actinomycetota bacterium]|nr:hypothetical protein [Actinomycetota bacterium]
MKKSAALLVLLALATWAAAPVSAGRKPSSLTRGLDLSLDRPLRLPERGATLTRRTLSLSSVTNDRLSRSLRAGEITAAEFALERAEDAFAGDVEGEMSLLLTDLALRVRYLRGTQRERALALLARPTDPDSDVDIDHASYRNNEVSASCSAHFCIHYTETGRHAVDDLDYVESVKLEMEYVWDAEVDGLGFKVPKSDATSENTVPPADAAKLDVYLLDAGADGVYGYCTTDDPNLIDPDSRYEYFDASSYCALDNDFDSPQFLGAPPEDSLRVTAAHEFFHAIQLSYAAGHDTWMSEGTAALIEDLVHDAINDNYQYLRASALRRPSVSLDKSTAPEHYGAWLFWRFLTEIEGTDGAAIIRETWQQAAVDGPGAPGFYSVFAVKRALAARDISFPNAFAFFSLVNYVPEAFYEEGAAYLQAVGGKRPPLMGNFTLSSSRRSTGNRVARLNHLSAGYVAFKPGAGVTKLNVAVDLPTSAASPRATLLTLTTDGRAFQQSIGVDSAGLGAVKNLPFNRSTVRMVVLVLDNASTRFTKCYRRNTPWACSGQPADQALPFTVATTAR